MVYYVNPGIRPKDQKPTYTLYYEWLNGDFDKIELYDRSPDGGVLFVKLKSGRPMKPDDMPTAVERFDPNRKPTPLLDVEALSGHFFVNGTFKDILEALEPGIHQFFPMEIVQKGKKVADYYFLNVCSRLDAYHPELTYPRDERGFVTPVEGQPSSLVFSTEAIGEHHMWVDEFAGGHLISDTFAKRLQDAGLTGTSYHEYKQA